MAACEQCNKAKGNRPVEEYLRRRPKVLARVQTHLKRPMSAAAHLNAIIPRLLAELRGNNWTVAEHDAAQTAANRRLLDIPKSHFNDAAVLGPITGIRNMPSRILDVRAAGRGQRQRAIVDKYGTPRGKGVPGLLPAYTPGESPNADSRTQGTSQTIARHRRQRPGGNTAQDRKPPWNSRHLPEPG